MSVSIPVVIGTGREGRWSSKVARFVHGQLASHEGVSTELIDVRDHLIAPFTIPAWVEDENAQKWRTIASEAAGFVFVVPEYNRNFPGEFKLLFDSAYKEYSEKPVVVVSVSSGQFGGVRAVEHLMPMFIAAGMLPLKAVATAHVEELFANEVPDNEKYIQFVDEALKALATYVTN